jgi:hypothetical protein
MAKDQSLNRRKRLNAHLEQEAKRLRGSIEILKAGLPDVGPNPIRAFPPAQPVQRPEDQAARK